MSTLIDDMMKARMELLSESGFPYTPSFNFMGMPVFESPLLTETEEYQEIIDLTFKQRWIEPISSFHNFQTMPFEPWLKTRKLTKVRQVPSRKIMFTQFGLLIHPVIKKELSAILSNITA